MQRTESDLTVAHSNAVDQPGGRSAEHVRHASPDHVVPMELWVGAHGRSSRIRQTTEVNLLEPPAVTWVLRSAQAATVTLGNQRGHRTYNSPLCPFRALAGVVSTEGRERGALVPALSEFTALSRQRTAPRIRAGDFRGAIPQIVVPCEDT